MDHAEAVALLPELHDGSLRQPFRAELERHLERCEDCRALSATLDSLASALREHPTSKEIVSFALGGTVAAPVARHCAECATCADEVERTQRAHARAAELASLPTTRRGWTRGATYGAIAASLLLIVLAIDDARLRQRAPVSRSGGYAADLKVLSSALRDEAEPEVIRAGEGQPYVPIAVEVDRAAQVAPEGDVRFEIASEAGTPTWSLVLGAERVQRDLREAGIVTLLVPGEVLEPGHYEMIVTGGGAELLRVLFRIER